MFTGLVECHGQDRHPTGERAWSRARESPAPSARCRSASRSPSTARASPSRGRRGRPLEADVSAETLERTTLGSLAVGSAVNLERSLPIGARLGGHLVTGHVDGVGALVGRTPVGDATKMTFSIPGAPVAARGREGLDCHLGRQPDGQRRARQLAPRARRRRRPPHRACHVARRLARGRRRQRGGRFWSLATWRGSSRRRCRAARRAARSPRPTRGSSKASSAPGTSDHGAAPRHRPPAAAARERRARRGFRAGRMVILVDDEDRENEGDLTAWRPIW